MEKFKWQIVAILLVILVLMLGSATKLKNARNIELKGAVSGAASFDGSKNISITTTQANIAVIEGVMTTNNGSSLAQTIQYPNGFNLNNCIVIAVMLHHKSNTSGVYTAGSTFNATSYSLGGIPCRVQMQSNGMAICAENIIIDDGVVPKKQPIGADFLFKIVLMKIQ